MKPGGRVVILVNGLKDDAERFARAVADRVGEDGWSASLFVFQGKPAGRPDLEGADMVVCLGGDGTVLYAARMAAPLGIPVLPVNLGSLGFMAWVRRGEWYERFDAAVAGRLPLSRRMMLDVEVVRDGTVVGRFPAMNDGVVSGAGPARIISLSISVSGSSLGTYRSDGVIVATPTGSTAYSLAAGGPILDPDMDAMVFNPICPHTLSNRPLVLPGDESVEAYVERGQREQTVLTVDGQDFLPLEEGDRVRFRKGPDRAFLYSAGRGAFYQVLRARLNWSGGPDA